MGTIKNKSKNGLIWFVIFVAILAWLQIITIDWGLIAEIAVVIFILLCSFLLIVSGYKRLGIYLPLTSRFVGLIFLIIWPPYKDPIYQIVYFVQIIPIFLVEYIIIGLYFFIIHRIIKFKSVRP